MDNSIKEFAKDIAKEISERSIMDVDNVALMIEVRLKSSMIDFVSEYSVKEEKEYLKILEQQSKTKRGSRQYVELGYKLALAKSKKSAANRTANNLRQTDIYSRFKSWITQKYGREVVDEFISSELTPTPIYTTL